MGRGVWLGALPLTGVTVRGRKVSTQRKHAFAFAGSDVQGKCKRITLDRCMYVGLCIMHGRRKRGQGANARRLSPTLCEPGHVNLLCCPPGQKPVQKILATSNFSLILLGHQTLISNIKSSGTVV